MKYFAISALMVSANAINVKHDGIKFQHQVFGDDGFPGYIIPGSEPLLPIPSAPIDMNNLQLASKMGEAPEMSVAEARLQAAQMQAQMDASVAEADQKRADQQKQYESNI